MPTITLTPQNAPGRYPTANLTPTWQAVAAADTVRYTNTGNQLILARNTHATNSSTVATNSVAMPGTGRLGNIAAETIAAGAQLVIGPLAQDGWTDSSGFATFTAGGTGTLAMACIQLP